MNSSSSEVKSFYEHLLEIRNRIFLCVVVVGITSIIGYFINDFLLSVLISPLRETVYYTSPTGGFEAVFNVSLLFGILAAAPFIIYQLLRFIAPAMPPHPRKLIMWLIIGSWLLMGLGLVFAYFFSLPTALTFLKGFGSSQVRSLISTDQYFSFVLRYLGGYALLFQLPLIIVGINFFKHIRPRAFLNIFRYVIVVSFILAAIITPTPDPINQAIMALPIIVLYAVTALILTIKNRKYYSR